MTRAVCMSTLMISESVRARYRRSEYSLRCRNYNGNENTYPVIHLKHAPWWLVGFTKQNRIPRYERRASSGGSLKCQKIGRLSRLHDYSAGGWRDEHMRQSEVSGSTGVYLLLEEGGIPRNWAGFIHRSREGNDDIIASVDGFSSYIQLPIVASINWLCGVVAALKVLILATPVRSRAWPFFFCLFIFLAT